MQVPLLYTHTHTQILRLLEASRSNNRQTATVSPVPAFYIEHSTAFLVAEPLPLEFLLTLALSSTRALAPSFLEHRLEVFA